MGWIHGDDDGLPSDDGRPSAAPLEYDRLRQLAARQLPELQREVNRLQAWEAAEKEELNPFSFFLANGSRVPVDGHRITKDASSPGGFKALWLVPKMRGGAVVPQQVTVMDCPCFPTEKMAAQFRAAMANH